MVSDADGKFKSHDELVSYLGGQGFSRGLIEAFRAVDRKDFTLEKETAYFNEPSMLINSQTTSQPLIVGIMIDALEVKNDSVVLEVGTGSGYQTVLLSYLAGAVHTIEVNEAIHRLAGGNILRYCKQNVVQHHGNALRYVFNRKFDRIIVSACCTRLHNELFCLLNDDGIMVAPVQDETGQSVMKVGLKTGQMSKNVITRCRFVMMEEDNGSGARKP